MRIIAFIIIIIFQLPLIAQNSDWQTKFEKSDYQETVTYEECVLFSKALADESEMIHYREMGYSPQNRAIPLLIVDKEGLTSAEDIKNAGRLILFIQAGIHAGEPDGTDATFLLLRDMVIHQKQLALLDKVSLLFIPSFNVDGLDRMSPYNRINQNGPTEMGWRANSMNLNLNRDYMKADSPEMKAWLQIFNEYLPDLFIDCHTTDGADYQYVATYALENFGNMDEGLTEFTDEVYNPYLVESMKQKDSPIFPYVSFMNWHDPRSGLVRSVGTPMISQGYTALQNRIGLLIETHMLKPYKPRVYATKDLIVYTLETMNKYHEKLRILNQNADAMMSSYKKGIKELTIKYEVDYSDTAYVDFLGMEYDVVKSDLTGGDWFQYSQDPTTFNLMLFEKQKSMEKVELPIAYVIPVEYEEVQDIIKSHGIEYTISKEAMDVEIETYKFSNQKYGSSSFESHQNISSFDMVDVKATQNFEAGAMIVPVRQRALKVLVYLLEPKADNSLVSWGFFNSSMERKEYAETYVMEKMARVMIAENPPLLDEFKAWKEENPELAKNHWMQCMWFYARTPYMDPKKDVYPVGKIVDMQELFKLGWH